MIRWLALASERCKSWCRWPYGLHVTKAHSSDQKGSPTCECEHQLICLMGWRQPSRTPVAVGPRTWSRVSSPLAL